MHRPMVLLNVKAGDGVRYTKGVDVKLDFLHIIHPPPLARVSKYSPILNFHAVVTL